MKSLKGTKTEKNLMEAFAGESQAHSKYTYFASQAKKDGYEQIANYFTETAKNEIEHAKIWFKYLNDGKVPSTDKNLAVAASGENFEWTNMYKRMAQEAKQEGFNEIAYLFEQIAIIEANHEKRYLALLENVKNKKVFESSTPVEWVCMNCGNIIKANSAPEICPVCKHAKAYYKRAVKDF